MTSKASLAVHKNSLAFNGDKVRILELFALSDFANRAEKKDENLRLFVATTKHCYFFKYNESFQKIDWNWETRSCTAFSHSRTCFYLGDENGLMYMFDINSLDEIGMLQLSSNAICSIVPHIGNSGLHSIITVIDSKGLVFLVNITKLRLLGSQKNNKVGKISSALFVSGRLVKGDRNGVLTFNDHGLTWSNLISFHNKPVVDLVSIFSSIYCAAVFEDGLIHFIDVSKMKSVESCSVKSDKILCACATKEPTSNSSVKLFVCDESFVYEIKFEIDSNYNLCKIREAQIVYESQKCIRLIRAFQSSVEDTVLYVLSKKSELSAIKL